MLTLACANGPASCACLAYVLGTLRAVYVRVTVCAAWGALGDRFGVDVFG